MVELASYHTLDEVMAIYKKTINYQSCNKPQGKLTGYRF